MRRVFGIGLMGLLLGAAGCGPGGSPNSFQGVDLTESLDRGTLSRYEQESQASHAAGHHGSMAVLEHSNWWPIGLLAYWWAGTAMRTAAPTGETAYHVASSTGFGPLSVLYVSQTHGAFDAKGKRLSTMSMASVLWGHLAMFHDSDVVLPNGQRQQMSSIHLLHHFINIHTMDGHTTFSLFSAPNPVGVETASGHDSMSHGQ